jgi:hypothetical protein
MPMTSETHAAATGDWPNFLAFEEKFMPMVPVS